MFIPFNVYCPITNQTHKQKRQKESEQFPNWEMMNPVPFPVIVLQMREATLPLEWYMHRTISVAAYGRVDQTWVQQVCLFWK